MPAPVQVARQQTTPELSGTFWTLASDPIPTLAGTLRNPPELSEPCLWNLHQHAPELSRTLQNLPRPSGTNRSEPSGTYVRNLRQHTPEPSGTFRNPAPEPTPAHAGTLRNLPEPSSGTCSCDPHRHTPVLIWAEDPTSLRCWGKKAASTGFWLQQGHVSHGEKIISFGGIPNSSSIILMPRLTTWAPFFLRSSSAHMDNVITKTCSKQSHGCPWQGCKATNHTVTFRNLPNPASGTYTSAHRNSPEPASGTYGSTHQNSLEPSGSWLRNLQ